MAHTSHASGPLLTPQKINADLLEVLNTARSRTTPALLLTGLMCLIGLAGIAIRIGGGFTDRAAWGYYAALMSWLLATACGAPIAVIVTRLARGDWRRPFTRVGDIYAITPLIMFFLVVPLMFTLPPLDGRRNLYMNWPGAPYAYIFLAFLAFAIVGTLQAYLSILPDTAMLRDQDAGAGDFARRRSAYWIGSVRQWAVHRSALVFVTGPLYFIMLGGVQLIFATDFSMSLVPGWVDAIYPGFTGVTGLQAGLATLILTLGIVRQTGGLQRYLTEDQFWGLGKLLLALTLMWFYFWWSMFIIYWYGRKPNQQAVLELIMFGPYSLAFFISISFNLLIPFLGVLMWNGLRKSVRGPIIASCFIVVGNLFDRIRLYTSAYSIPNDLVQHHTLEDVNLPAFHTPDLADVCLFIGAMGLLATIMLVAARTVPVLAAWEVKEGLLYRVVKPFHHGHVTIVGKPD